MGVNLEGKFGEVRTFYQNATPTADNTNDLWYETDTNFWWFWDGTRWLSMQLFQFVGEFDNVTTGASEYLPREIDQAIQHDLFLVDLTMSSFVSAPNTLDTHYWNVDLVSRNRDGGGNVSYGTLTTNGNTADDWEVDKTVLSLPTVLLPAMTKPPCMASNESLYGMIAIMRMVSN